MQVIVCIYDYATVQLMDEMKKKHFAQVESGGIKFYDMYSLYQEYGDPAKIADSDHTV